MEEDTDLWTEQDNERAEMEDGISGELTEMTKESWEVRTNRVQGGLLHFRKQTLWIMEYKIKTVCAVVSLSSHSFIL